MPIIPPRKGGTRREEEDTEEEEERLQAEEDEERVRQREDTKLLLFELNQDDLVSRVIARSLTYLGSTQEMVNLAELKKLLGAEELIAAAGGVFGAADKKYGNLLFD